MMLTTAVKDTVHRYTFPSLPIRPLKKESTISTIATGYMAWSTGSASELFGKDYSFVADGISTSDYIAMGESQGYRGQALVQNSTTTLTHELGHYLGLPVFHRRLG